MKIFHNDTCISDTVDIADSFWKRFKGLMFQSSLKRILFIKKCNSIHMCFMKFPIDALFVDGSLNVVKIYHSLKPWRISSIHFNAKHVFECPAGFAEKHGIREGDALILKQSEK